MKNNLAILSNIMYCLVIFCFGYMIIDDIRFVCSNTGNIAGSMPVEMENTLYIFFHMLPFVLFLIIFFMLYKKCKAKGIKTLHSFVLDFTKMHRWIMAVIVSACFIIVICSVLYYAQNRLIYYPNFDIEAHAALTNSNSDKYEEITIQTGKGVCRGWGYRYSEKKPTILYFGGNAQTSAGFMAAMSKNLRQGYNWVMIDYPGYGASSGIPEYNGILESADNAYNFICDSPFYGNDEIIVAGFSLGTGVATYVASKFEVDKLVLVAPYDNGVNLYNSFVNIFHGPLKLLVRNPFPSSDYAQKVRCPVLIIASEDDEVVSYVLSEKLKSFFFKVQMSTYTGLRHNDIFNDSQVKEEFLRFLSNTL